MKKIVFITGLLMICASCATFRATRETYKNYDLNREQIASIGSPMVSVKNITFIEGKEWVGIARSSDGWHHFRYATDDSFKEELIYTGRSASTIFVSYKEYKKEFARPAFFQELRYDLAASDIIVFRDYRMKVHEATNEMIRFMMISDPHLNLSNNGLSASEQKENPKSNKEDTDKDFFSKKPQWSH